MQVVGLTGFAGAGKSTVAEYLVKEHGFTRLSFAAPLKKMLRTLNPIMGSSLVLRESRNGARSVTLDDVFRINDNNELYVKASIYGDEYRRLLQVLGTDCIRSVDPEFWVKAAMKQITQEHGRYVFDDVRFPNEAEVISKLNTLGLWNIQRPGYAAVNGHASEQHAGNMGERFILANNGDLEGLHDQIDFGLDMATFDPAMS